jgi:hypothetical protein
MLTVALAQAPTSMVARFARLSKGSAATPKATVAVTPSTSASGCAAATAPDDTPARRAGAAAPAPQTR